jgi:integrase
MGGVNPVEQRKAARALLVAESTKRVTFEWCAAEYIKAHRAGWKNAKHADQWANTLRDYAHPVIGKLAVADVSRELVLRILQPIWLEKNETAGRLRGRIEVVLDWAKAAGYRAGDNPAAWKGNLEAALAKPSKIKKVASHPAVQTHEMGAFMQALRGCAGVSAKALAFVALTAARSGEVRGMVWGEVDRKAGVWVVPAERMKADKEHRVPLSRQALALLDVQGWGDAGAVVFPGVKGQALSDMSLTAVTRKLAFKDKAGRVCVPHGLRSTFRDWAGEFTNYPRELAEQALAHAIGDATEQAYRRGDALEKRRGMMQAWAEFCDTVRGDAQVGGGSVVSLRAA